MLAIAVAPSATADSGLADNSRANIQACTPPNPNAWVGACVSLVSYSRTVNAYTLDTTPATTTVCPVNNVCVDVPVILDLLDPQSYTVYYYIPDATVTVSPNNVIDDLCDVIGIYCPIIVLQKLVDVTGDGIIDGTLYENAEGDLFYQAF